MIDEYMMHGPGQLFFPGFPILMQFLLFLLFLGIVYWLIKSGQISNESPKDILKKRLAKGEITKKEYNELLKEISK